MPLIKPKQIETNKFMSAKWDEITEGREFAPSTAPTIATLCQWYAVIDQCMSDISTPDGIQVAYQNDLGDIKGLPQIPMMKQASAEIRAINKQLGINDEAYAEPTAKVTTLEVIRANYHGRSATA